MASMAIDRGLGATEQSAKCAGYSHHRISQRKIARTLSLRLFKRAKDLSIPVRHIDLFPGLGGIPSDAARKAAAYSAQRVSIP